MMSVAAEGAPLISLSVEHDASNGNAAGDIMITLGLMLDTFRKSTPRL